MKIAASRLWLFVFLVLLLSGISSCSREYDCSDLQIGPAFIGFAPADIDTFVLRKYKPNDNYQNLVDTFQVSLVNSGQYYTSNDTTSVFVTDGKNGMKAGYDWILYIPATNRTVTIADIVSEKKTGSCGSGIFSMDKFGCTCTNDVFSAKKDGQLVQFSSLTRFGNYIFIRN